MPYTSLLHSVSYSGSWGQPALALDRFIVKAAELGFDGVMLMAKRPHLSILDYGDKERTRLRQLNARIPIICKIEKPEGWQNLDAILAESDGVMVARGDLGVEIALEKVPEIQKGIISKMVLGL